MLFVCDQQYNGFGTYHKLAMTFKLKKDLKRRRLSADTKAGEKGTFA